MAYTATKYFTPKPFLYPRGSDNTQRNQVIRGQLLDCSTPTEYSVGGIGSSAFEVTAFSAVGLVTFSALLGVPLVNGQKVVIYNTSSNTNDGTYFVSGLTYTSATAGTFTAVPLPFNTLAGSAQTSQTAEGVGQMQWGARALQQTTLTLTGVTVSGTTATITYTTLSGPQLFPAEQIVITGMTNSGNNGTFTINAILVSTATTGSIQITNASAVASDSGSGTANLLSGVDDSACIENPTPPVIIGNSGGISLAGLMYVWDNTNQTVRIFGASGSAGVATELALGAHAVLESALYFQAQFPRGPAAY
jgi:hypothetical protein